MRLSVGAVNVRSGNFVYFDSATRKIGPEHIMASAALPPGFPAVEIEGEHYWDGGIVTNTPLQWLLDRRRPLDTLRSRWTCGARMASCHAVWRKCLPVKRKFGTQAALGLAPIASNTSSGYAAR